MICFLVMIMIKKYSFSDRLEDSSSKSAYPLFMQVIRAINGTPKFMIEKSEGIEDIQTGKFDGLIGQLIRKEVDIGGTAVYMMSNRVQNIDFIPLNIQIRSEILLRAPPLSYVSNIYYYPFVGIVWIASAIFTVLGAMEIYFTYILPKTGTDINTDTRDGFSEILLLASGLISQVGLHLSPRKTSGQIAEVAYIH